MKLYCFTGYKGEEHIVRSCKINVSFEGRRGCDRMVVGFTTTCAISAYYY